MKLYMFRTGPLSIIRAFLLYTAMVYVIQVCGQLASRIRMENSSILILLASCCFGIKLNMFRTVPLSIIRTLLLYTAMVYVTQVWGQLASRFRMENSSILILLASCYFGIKLYMFRTVPQSIIRRFSLYTQQWYTSYRLCRQLTSRIRMFHPDPARNLSANLYDIYHFCVYSEKLLMMYRGTV